MMLLQGHSLRKVLRGMQLMALPQNLVFAKVEKPRRQIAFLKDPSSFVQWCLGQLLRENTVVSEEYIGIAVFQLRLQL
jgi:hypothetical protein